MHGYRKILRGHEKGIYFGGLFVRGAVQCGMVWWGCLLDVCSDSVAHEFNLCSISQEAKVQVNAPNGWMNAGKQR